MKDDIIIGSDGLLQLIREEIKDALIKELTAANERIYSVPHELKDAIPEDRNEKKNEKHKHKEDKSAESSARKANPNPIAKYMLCNRPLKLITDMRPNKYTEIIELGIRPKLVHQCKDTESDTSTDTLDHYGYDNELAIKQRNIERSDEQYRTVSPNPDPRSKELAARQKREYTHNSRMLKSDMIEPVLSTLPCSALRYDMAGLKEQTMNKPELPDKCISAFVPMCSYSPKKKQ